MKTKIILIACCFFYLQGHAQEIARKTIGIVTFAPNDPNYNTDPFTDALVNAFTKTKRFNIVERSKLKSIVSEKELQKGDDFINGKVIKQGKSVGADYLVIGNIISSETKVTDSNVAGQVMKSYKAFVTLSVKIIDVTTSMVVNAETLNIDSGKDVKVMGVKVMKTTLDFSENSALMSALKNSEKSIDDFIYRNFPKEFSIIEIQKKDKKDRAEEILITGLTEGMKSGDRLIVVEEITYNIEGKTKMRKKQIGSVSIQKVEGEFCVCKVTDGGDEIVNRFEQNPKLKVVTK